MTVVNINSLTINSMSGVQGYGPFANNRNITSVDLAYVPWTNNSMYYAFYNCNNLTSVTNINENITNMSYTFHNCKSLVNAPSISNSVTNMGWTFARCNNLVNAPVIPNSVTDMTYTFSECNNLVNAPAIQNRVNIMAYTFYGCNSLVNAPVIPNSVTNMLGTFHNCTSLVNAPVIPYKVFGYINDYSVSLFKYCSSLTGDIYFHTVKIISASHCFYNSPLQKNVYLPYNQLLGIYTDTYNAFNNAGYKPSEVRNGVYIKENPYFLSTNDFWWDSYYNIIYKYLGSNSDIVVSNTINGHNISLLDLTLFNIPNTITSIDFGNVIVSGNMRLKFNNYIQLQSATNLNPNSDVTSMTGTFNGCSSLVNAPNIPNSVISTESTFQNCTKLVNAPVIPNSVTNMAFMFKFCTNLVNVPVIPNSVTNMGWAFEWCTNLINAPVIPNSVTNMMGTFNCCYNINTAPVIPDNVTIMMNTFYSCNNLAGNIYIKSFNVTNAYRCFYFTTNTKNVYIPFTYKENGVNTITYNSFKQYYGSGENGVTLVNYTDLYNE